MSRATVPGDDAHLKETLLRSEPIWRGRLLDVRRDTVTLPDGTQATREYIVHPGAVMIVPLLPDGRLLMERQHRYPVGRVMLEFPAGKIDAGEAPFSCAVRELQEETGYRAAEWARAGCLHNAVSYSTEGIDIWFARGLAAGEPRRDPGEFLDTVAHTAAELDAMVECGEVTDAKTLIGLLWLQKWQAGQWNLPWRPV